MTSICEALAADRRLTIRDQIERFGIGYGTMHRILTEDLQMSKAILGSTSASNVKMSSSDRLGIRVIIKFYQDLGKTPTQMLKLIEQTKREN